MAKQVLIGMYAIYISITERRTQIELSVIDNFCCY